MNVREKTDVREKLGRLNPTTIRYDTGAGGVPELTNIDIAAALGMVSRGLGREVLEACWWPGGANLRRNGLRDAVVALVCTEMARQSKRLVNAHLDLQLAEAAVQWSGKPASREQSREIERSREKLGQVRKIMWPNNTMDRLPSLTRAIIAEIAGCQGCGEDEGGRVSDRQRAIAMGVDVSDYPKRWRAPYEWLMAEMVNAERVAVQELERALRMGAG